MKWVGVGKGGSTASLENLRNILQKIREILKSVRAIFDVFSRYRSIPGEHMLNLQNDKYDSGRTHPKIDKIKQCVRPLSTRQRANITRYL
jgi:predicted flavoprotein YhiN